MTLHITLSIPSGGEPLLRKFAVTNQGPPLGTTDGDNPAGRRIYKVIELDADGYPDGKPPFTLMHRRGEGAAALAAHVLDRVAKAEM